VAFSYESHVDMIAQRMKLDPIELRRKNLLNKGEDFAAGDTPTDCDLKGALAQVAEGIGWGRDDSTPAKSGVRRGKGIACALKDGGGTKKAAHAMVKILNDGSVAVFSGSVEIGQGVQTVLRQAANSRRGAFALGGWGQGRRDRYPLYAVRHGDQREQRHRAHGIGGFQRGERRARATAASCGCAIGRATFGSKVGERLGSLP
jgi:hypothetical protein